MPSWLVNLIVATLLVLIFLTLLAIACIKFSYRLSVKNQYIKQLEKENRHKQQLLDAYGIKEIIIGKEKDE